MTRALHPMAGMVALLIILTFWVSTALSEAFGSASTVIAVKTAIPWGFLVLVPALMVTGGTGFSLSKSRRSGLVGVKLKRMPLIAANGVFVLIPSALFLASKANAGEFDTVFQAIQTIELVAGGVNITLLGLNLRDGLRMTASRRLVS